MILVTGANGFVGRQVVRALSCQGVPLRLVVRRGAGCLSAIEDSGEIVEVSDVFNAERAWWTKVLGGIETVVHMAWYTEPGKYLTSPLNLDCLKGTIEMALAIMDSDVRRFVGTGTCAEYDLNQGMLRVDSPLDPKTLYAACKASTFQVLSQLFPAAGVEFAWCRLFYLYGEGEDSRRLVPYLRERLSRGESAELTGGYQIRDFLDVENAGRMIADVSLGDQQGAVNICSGVPVTVRQMAEQVADQYGRRDLLLFGARPENIFDPPCVVGVR